MANRNVIIKDKKEEEDSLDKEVKIRRIAERKGLKGDRLLHFMAQTKHETGNFKQFEEDPNYTVKGMRKTFSKAKDMSDEELKEVSPVYKGNKKKFFDTFYSNRKDLGTKEGEGSKYYGRGPIQITGKSNYKKYNVDPDRMNDLKYATEKSVELFKDKTKNLPENAKSDDYTKKINKYTKSYRAREANYKKYKNTESEGSFYFGSAKPKKEVDDSGRSPQSIDQVKNTQSSILKDEEMAQDLRKPASVEEEEEKTVDAKRQEFNANAIQNTPGGQNMSEVQKRKVMKEQTNSENQVRSSAETQKKKASGEQISTKDNFMEAITFFLPSIVGGVVGHAIGGGEGAAQGVQMGMKGAADYRSAKLAREKFEHAKIQDQGDDLAKQRIEVQKSNLELRKQEVAEQRKRTTNLEDDRSLRREERKLQRQITSKESFGKRGDVKKLQDQGLMLNDIKNITTDAPEIAAGVIGFKIAKGIAGEVGNLTESERNDAQISPSFYRKMMRSGTKFLMGKLPESDVTELKKVVAVLEKRRKQKLGSIIDGFTSSRYKGDDAFRKDLRNEFGVEEKQGKGRMTDAQRQRLEELRKKHR